MEIGWKWICTAFILLLHLIFYLLPPGCSDHASHGPHYVHAACQHDGPSHPADEPSVPGHYRKCEYSLLCHNEPHTKKKKVSRKLMLLPQSSRKNLGTGKKEMLIHSETSGQLQFLLCGHNSEIYELQGFLYWDKLKKNHPLQPFLHNYLNQSQLVCVLFFSVCFTNLYHKYLKTSAF